MELYIIIQWPEVQDLMGYEWFRTECYLLQSSEHQEHIDSAYFVPVKRLKEVQESFQSYS